MSKQLIVSVIIGLFIAGAGVFAFTQSKDSEPAVVTNLTTSQSEPTTTMPTENTESAPAGEGEYIDFDEAKFASTKGKKVLFFHAPWCLQCRSIESGITPGSIPTNVTIFKVDYDSRQDLRQKYDVRLQTTFVVVNDQNEVEEKYVAYEDPYFDSVKRALF